MQVVGMRVTRGVVVSVDGALSCFRSRETDLTSLAVLHGHTVGYWVSPIMS
jgi:hypothetical protein